MVYIIEVKCLNGIWYIDDLKIPTENNKYFKTDFWALGDSKIMALKFKSRKEAFEALCQYPICCGGTVKIIKYSGDGCNYNVLYSSVSLRKNLIFSIYQRRS